MTARLTQLIELLKEMPEDTFLKYGIGLEYVSRGDDENALAYFSEIRTTKPDYLANYYQLGKLYERLNRRDDAVQTYTDGAIVARSQKDIHTMNELQNALEEIE